MGERIQIFRPDGTVQTIDTRTLTEAQAEAVAAIKEVASARILAICPEYKQRNLTAQAANLALLFPGTRGDELPEPHRSEYLAGKAIWDAISAIRAASDAAEAAVMGVEDNDAADAAAAGF